MEGRIERYDEVIYGVEQHLTSLPEVDPVVSVRCDFSKVHDQDLRAEFMHGNAKYWSRSNMGPLKWHMKHSSSMLEVQLYCGRICVGEGQVKLPIKPTHRNSNDS